MNPLKLAVNVGSAAKLAQTLARDRELAMLFRDLATLRTNIPLFDDVDELRWKGSMESLPDFPRDALRAARAQP